jgi:hypothetical protein
MFIPMIRCELLRDRPILIITSDGPPKNVDFERPASEIDSVIASRGELTGLMLCAKSFPGWRSFDALVAHLKFIADHHRRIDRIAVVSDSGLLKIMPRIADLKVRHFGFHEKDRALTWLENGR